MKKTAAYMAIGLASAATAGVVVASFEEIPKLFNQAVIRAVSARILQQQDPMSKTVRVGGAS